MSATTSWADANQQALVAEIAAVRALIERHARGAEADADAGDDDGAWSEGAAEHGPYAMDIVASSFGLSPFERRILATCAAVELNGDFPALCAQAHGDPGRPYPSFSLALAAFPDAHWGALAPDAPLRLWHLVEPVPGAVTPLTAAPLRIDERILHFLAGIDSADARLAGVVDVLREPAALVPSHQALATRVADAWSTPAAPLVQLVGGDEEAKRAVAGTAAAAAGMRLYVLLPDAVPSSPAELETLLRLWEREAALCGGALYVDAGRLEGDAARATAIERLLERCTTPVALGVRDRWRPLLRTTLTLDVPRPGTAEQRDLWRLALGDRAATLNGAVDGLVAQFDLPAAAIHAVAAEATTVREGDTAGLGRALWEATRTRARSRLDDLAQRIEPAATWDDLVLPESQRQTLRDLASHVRQRSRVYDAWGFAAKGTRGLGISALFAGTSGTGKTMAAEVLGIDLRLDVYRIDLSAVVSKYIGETEKNLRRVFEAAEESGAILLFDEADALFGKRSEVKDSHDRYANIEVSYLLQRMESYRGLAVLTTNLKAALDPAFLRRIRFVVQFPFPGTPQREEIWRRVFPAATPTEGLDYGRLGRLSVAGGNIRNIALHAAFLAADAGEPVRMGHLLHAARGEYAKLEKSLTDAEVGGWT